MLSVLVAPCTLSHKIINRVQVHDIDVVIKDRRVSRDSGCSLYQAERYRKIMREADLIFQAKGVDA